jgi:hypothetical protein
MSKGWIGRWIVYTMGEQKGFLDGIQGIHDCGWDYDGYVAHAVVVCIFLEFDDRFYYSSIHDNHT